MSDLVQIGSGQATLRGAERRRSEMGEDGGEGTRLEEKEKGRKKRGSRKSQQTITREQAFSFLSSQWNLINLFIPYSLRLIRDQCGAQHKMK